MKTKLTISRLRIAFLMVMLMIANHAFTQCGFSNSYPNAGGWTTNGCFPTCYSIGPSSFNFNTTPCGAYNYATTPTPCTLNDSCWCADIDFSYVARSSTGVAHTLLSFTSDTLNSWNVTPGFGISNNNVIEAYLNCPPFGAANTDSIFGRSKLGTTWSAPSRGIAVLPGNTYYIRLQRLSPGQGLICVFSNAARTIPVAGSPQCFTINPSVAGLGILQHGAIPQGAPARTMTGTLSNLVANSVNTGITGMPLFVLCGRSATLNLCVNSVCGASSYTWSGPASFSVTSGQGTSCITAFISPASSGTITCTISFPGAACGITQTVPFTLNPLPSVSAVASPSTICSGASSTLTASGASTYIWSPPISSTNPVVSVSPTVTTTYTVTGTSAAGCSRSATVTVFVNPSPTANAGPSDSTCCGSIWYLGAVGGSASGGTPPYTYNWSPTTNFIGCTTCANPPVFSCAGGPTPVTYTLTVTDANGCTATSTVTIYFNTCRLANPHTNQQNGVTTSDDMSIAPNPTNGNFMISFSVTSMHDVEIVDLLGETVYRKAGIVDSSISVDLSTLPKGVYFVKCREGDKILVQRIVLQ
jgi:hypothetical protein